MSKLKTNFNIYNNIIFSFLPDFECLIKNNKITIANLEKVQAQINCTVITGTKNKISKMVKLMRSRPIHAG